MVLRKFAAIAPVIAALALAVPVAGASAQTTAAPPSPALIPCYPYPAFCGPGGQPWFSLQPLTPGTLSFPGLTSLPGLTPLPGLPFP
jgi:hypothetical protein